MKKPNFLSFGAFFIVVTLFLISCKDECDGIICQNDGICNNGICQCEPYYEGEFCETESREKFIGTYSVVEDCLSGNYNFDITIGNSAAGINKIMISNFYGINISVTGEINGLNITIPTQVVSGITLSGSGTINEAGNIITLNYTLKDGSNNTDSCSSTLTKI